MNIYKNLKTQWDSVFIYLFLFLLLHKIGDEHHGLIRVESEFGKGSSFKLSKCWEFNKCGVEKLEGSASIGK